ncbi:MAG TPA: DUF1127 domain-containing protein [Acetobacteraceae bacterium]|nr:DUF1127 domain-containing protein [Acetobacteraceae bacterium]
MTGIGLALPALRQRGGLRHVLARLVEGWQHRRRLRQTRRYILEMDEHMLSDIGISRAQALFEIDRER